MMLSQGQRPIQDLLDSLSAEELDSCAQGPLGTNCGQGPLGSNVEEHGGQYSSPQQGTSAYPEGSSPYDRCKGNSTASSSRCSPTNSLPIPSFSEFYCSLLHHQRIVTKSKLILKLAEKSWILKLTYKSWNHGFSQ